MRQDTIVEPDPRNTRPFIGAPVSSVPPAISGAFWAVGGVLSATALFWLMRGYLNSGQASLLYLPIVIACAVRFGFGPAVLAAFLSFFCWDYFFLPPLHALSVTNPHDLISLVVFLVAAVTTGQLAAHARSQARDAQTRLRETVVLYQASHLISREIEPVRTLDALVEYVVAACHASHCAILRLDAHSKEFMAVNFAGTEPLTPEQEHLIRRTVVLGGHTMLIRQGVWPGGITTPLLFNGASLGAMSVGARKDTMPFSPQDERLILTLANHAAVVIARQMQEENANKQARQAAVLEERNRFANDIHDTLSHAFTGIKFLLEAALRVGPTPQAVDCITQARQLAMEGAQEARRSIWALRPVVLDDEADLPSAVRALVMQQTAGTALAADVVVDGEACPLPEAMEEHLLRICQEALTNVLRHAEATRVEMVIAFSETTIRISVKDNGQGFLVSSGQTQDGFGLVSMRQRAERVGGRFDVFSRIGEGTTITVSVPFVAATGTARHGGATMNPAATPDGSRPIRILIADDHAVLRTGLALILNSEEDMDVVAQASTGDDAVTLFRQHRPDITLMDLKMNGLSGIDAVAAIRLEFPAARLIILTSYDRDEDIYRSIRAGAMGYLVKDTPASEILEAIRAVRRGRKYFPLSVSDKLIDRVTVPDLSEREREVLHLLAQGQSNKEIAAALSLALGTVKYHINSLLSKLGAEDRTQAVIIAFRKGFVDVD